MVTFDLTPEKLNDYKRSLSGMKNIRKKLKLNISRNKEKKSVIDMEYRLELLNVIEGYMRIVVCANDHDKRLTFQNRK